MGGALLSDLIMYICCLVIYSYIKEETSFGKANGDKDAVDTVVVVETTVVVDTVVVVGVQEIVTETVEVKMVVVVATIDSSKAVNAVPIISYCYTAHCSFSYNNYYCIFIFFMRSTVSIKCTT